MGRGQQSNSNSSTSSQESNFLNVNIHPFSGDPEFLTFFFDQISDYQKLNKLTDDRILFYFKSKLVGASLQFFIQSPDCKAATTLKELQTIFDKFFSTDDTQAAVSKLSKFCMLPEEQIKNTAHRLDALFYESISLIK